ncbi:MAG: response regulator transcription factor [Lachnospiraceae bacterium]|nr:response regulator transcription factor [Lachnospiraceae bacterium]
MIKIAICDDEPMLTNYIKILLLKIEYSDEFEIDCFNTGAELIEKAIHKRKTYDVVFMDIELSEGTPDKFEESGMLISRKIKELYAETTMIFMTGYAGYEMQLLNYESFHFLKKPIFYKDLESVMNEVVEHIKNQEKKRFHGRKGTVAFHILPDEIIFFESKRPNILMKCSNHEEVFFKGRLDTIEDEIAKISNSFARPAKSFLVNMDFIRMHTKKSIILRDRTEIPVSRKYAKEFFKKLSY